MKYQILHAEYRQDLEALVNSFLAMGWETAGGLCMSFGDRSSTHFYQAIIFRTESKL